MGQIDGPPCILNAATTRPIKGSLTFKLPSQLTGNKREHRGARSGTWEHGGARGELAPSADGSPHREHRGARCVLRDREELEMGTWERGLSELHFQTSLHNLMGTKREARERVRVVGTKRKRMGSSLPQGIRGMAGNDGERAMCVGILGNLVRNVGAWALGA